MQNAETFVVARPDTGLGKWWARHKLWHVSTLTERYFSNADNEFSCIQLPTPLESDTPEQQTLARRNKILWEQAVMLRQALVERRKQRLSLPLSEVFKFELLVLRLLPNERLLTKLWSIRADFKKIVPPEMYQQYEDSKPPAFSRDEAQKADFGPLREDAIDVLSNTHWWYINTHYREKHIRRIKWQLFIGLVIFGITVLFLAKCSASASSFPLILLTVALMGAMGAILSIGRRMLPLSAQEITASDPVIRAIQLDNGTVGLRLSTAVGAVSAVVLYFLMASGLHELGGQLAPEFLPPQGVSGQSLNELFSFMRPKDSASFAKVLCWSFIAGFAEQLVPDMLDKFRKNGKPV